MPAAQFRDHVEAGEETVIEIVVKALGEGGGALGECPPRGVEVDSEERDGREVADHLVDAVVEREAVEDRQVHGEAPMAAPPPDGLGEGGEGARRRRDPVLLGPAFQGAPGRGSQSPAQAVEASRGIGLGVPGRCGKLRRRRQRVKTVHPVGAVALESRAGPQCALGDDIVPERHRGRLSRLAACRGVELAQQHLDARRVHGDQLDHEMHDRDPRGRRRPHIEQRPSRGVPGGGEHVRPDLLRTSIEGIVPGVSQIAYGNAIGLDIAQHLLVPVVVDHDSQHVVPGHECVPGAIDVGRHPRGIGDLHVCGAGDAAVVERLVTTELIGRLHLCEREWLVPVRGVGVDSDGIRLQIGQQLLLPSAQRLLAVIGESAAGAR